MKILGMSSPESGCGFHRVVLPLGYMNDIDGLITNIAVDEVMNQKWDILLYNRISQFDNKLQETKEKLGCKIVLDMDDDWLLPSNHINYHDYQILNPRIENNIREADMVTCTNERLYNRLRPFNSNVHIFPNALPVGEHQFTEDKIEDDKIRIFWCGGISHEADLEILKNPIRRLQMYKDKIKMVIGGYNENNELSKFIWDKMLSYFTNSFKLEFKAIRGTTPDKYFAMYKEADIMLIPLCKGDWFACKSNLKILEASVKGIPVICSKVEPYINDADVPVLWAENQTDWFKHINFLINNKQARLDYGEALKEWAKKRYNFTDIYTSRRTAFDNLVKS
jgi:glycosyltransferase involved in cell wall biosynthesis